MLAPRLCRTAIQQRDELDAPISRSFVFKLSARRLSPALASRKD
jgi:hypothetical protein